MYVDAPMLRVCVYKKLSSLYIHYRHVYSDMDSVAGYMQILNAEV